MSDYVDKSALNAAFKAWIDDGRPKPIPDFIARAILLIAKRTAGAPNFSDYTWRDEMSADAVVAMLAACDNYDPSKPTRSGNPNAFGYLSACCWNAYIARIKKEKEQLNLADEIILGMSDDEFGQEAAPALRETKAMIDARRLSKQVSPEEKELDKRARAAYRKESRPDWREKLPAPWSIYHEDGLAAKLTAYRTEHELTASEMGRRVGASASTIGRWETGIAKPAVMSLVRWAGEMGRSIDWLLGGDDRQDPPLDASRLGANLKRRREELGLPVSCYVEITGVAGCRLEEGGRRHSTKRLVECANGLCVKPSELLAGGKP